MNPVRFATLHGVIYLLPLSIWLCSQLALNLGMMHQVHSLFHQTVVLSIVAQIVGVVLLFARTQQVSTSNRIIASLVILLFPLPLWTLGWLTASVEPITLINAVMLVTTIDVAAFGLCRVITLLVQQTGFANSLIGTSQLALLMTLWQFRNLWLQWCGL